MFMRIFLVLIVSFVGLNNTMALTEIKAENAVWTIYANRQSITALALSNDGKTLWVATDGGLEKRDLQTGALSELFTTANGLPGNSIEALLNDDEGGLWIATSNSGLAYLDTSSKQFSVFNANNSGLLSDFVETLISDGEGGLYIGTMQGVVRYGNNRKWTTIFSKGDYELPDLWVKSLLLNKQGGLWVGTQGGYLFYRDKDDKWSIFSSSNSLLPANGGVQALLDDEQDGIWIGTAQKGSSQANFVGGGLVHFDAKKEWTIFNASNSKLPQNWVSSLLTDHQGGLWIGTSGGGLAHFDANKEWMVTSNSELRSKGVTCLVQDKENRLWAGGYWGVSYFNVAAQEWKTPNTTKPEIPDNRILSLFADKQGGLLLGTGGGGLAYRTGKQVFMFDTGTMSKLPSNIIYALSNDDNNGFWIGTAAGLVHYQADGTLTVFNAENSQLPYNTILTLSNDGQNGVWVGTVQDINAEQLVGGGLAHLNSNGQWTTLNKSNSQLPDNVVSTLSSDGKNGLWIGSIGGISSLEGRTGGGLAHLTADNQWTIYNIENSKLPSNSIESLLNDGQNGLWIGTSYWDMNHRGGLAHLTADNQWTLFDIDNSKLPTDWVTSLSNDGEGGIWVATPKGLLHLGADNKSILFNQENSNLPNNFLSVLSFDQKGGGLWVGTLNDGLAYLTFTNTAAICQDKQTTQQDCNALQNNQRAAIIIAGGGNESSNTLWDTIYSISNSIYNTLSKRGFDNDEIYYLSPVDWADFNGDGKNDQIVDAPKANRGIENADIQKALEWAKQRGKLDQPLYIFFVDHGGTEKLQLSKFNSLTASQFKQMLDDYQATTDNEIVLVIDACFSGVFGEKLKANKRSIITSAGNGYAYFQDKQGFSSFLVYWLNRGMNFSEAFGFATSEQKKLLGNPDVVMGGTEPIDKTNRVQTPQKYDQNQIYSLDKLVLNGNFITGDSTLAVRNITTSTQTKANIPFNLKAQASVALGDVKEVWAVVRPPRMDLILDSSGTPILAFPRVTLFPTNINNEWEETLNNTRYNGDYKITFYAKDKDGDVVSSEETITLTVSDGIEPPPQATLQIQLNQTNYKAGDLFKATITEELQWGYDLYVAVILPSGDFITLKEQNGFSNLNEIKTWYGNRSQGITNPFLELTLPALPAGQYCLFGALSPEGEPPLNAAKYWKQTTQCFTMN